jgi:hypothetical protein
MSLLSYVISGAVFFLLMLGILASHYQKAKRVDGTLVAAAVAFAIGIYFIVAIGVQTGRINDLQANLTSSTSQMAPGLVGAELQMAVPVVGEEGFAMETRPFPLVGLIAIIIGVVAMGLGAAASRRGDRSASQTLMALGIFLVVVAVVAFVAKI